MDGRVILRDVNVKSVPSKERRGALGQLRKIQFLSFRFFLPPRFEIRTRTSVSGRRSRLYSTTEERERSSVEKPFAVGRPHGNREPLGRKEFLDGLTRIAFCRCDEKRRVSGFGRGMQALSRMVGQNGHEHAVLHGKTFRTLFRTVFERTATLREPATGEWIPVPFDLGYRIQRDDIGEIHERARNRARIEA